MRLSLVAPFVAYLRDREVKPDRALASLGVSEASIEDPKIFVHAELVYGLLNAFSDIAGDPYLGVRVGEVHDFSQWPPFAEAANRSRTLAEFFAAFIQLVPKEANSVDHSLIIGAEHATYRVSRLIEAAIAPVQVTGFGCAHYVRLLRAVTGDAWDASQVVFESRHIAGVPPGYAGIETRASSDPGMLLSFPVEWVFRDIRLDLQTARHPPSAPLQEVTVVAALRSAVSRHLDAPDLGVAAVADILGLEPAHLVRALRQADTTLPREVKRLKIEAAQAKLRYGDDAIGEIAASLGYRHHAHFTRFFMSQTGVSPSTYRRQARGTARGHG